MASYTPAEAAELSGFSIDTLRYYEREGILSPVARTAGGRRVYSDDDLGRLGFLRCLRDTGMPIAQLRRYAELSADDATVPERIELLEQHEAAVQASIEALRAQQARLQEKLDLVPHGAGHPAGLGDGVRERPPAVADERTQLVGWLDLQRALIPWKCDGLSQAAAHRNVVPPSPLMTMAGLVSHLRWNEHCWFEVIFRNRGEAENPQFTGAKYADWQVAPDVPLERLVAEYRAQCAASNEIVAAHSLDDVAVHPEYGGETLRWILLHTLEETARHAGHADVVRELLDGSRGYY